MAHHPACASVHADMINCGRPRQWSRGSMATTSASAGALRFLRHGWEEYRRAFSPIELSMTGP